MKVVHKIVGKVVDIVALRKSGDIRNERFRESRRGNRQYTLGTTMSTQQCRDWESNQQMNQ